MRATIGTELRDLRVVGVDSEPYFKEGDAMRCSLHAFILIIAAYLTASTPSLVSESSHDSLAVKPFAAQTQNEDTNLFVARVFKSKRGETMPYRIFIPRDYNPHKKYPLVLWLHGGAGRGTDNLRQISGGNTKGSHIWISAEVQEKYPAFVIAPQCPEDEMWATVELAKPTRQLRIVEELLSSLQKEFNINSQQLYVSGQSLGGFGTWALISEHPETFAAAIPVCGGGDESMAPRLIHTAIWAFHGEQDQAVSVERSRKMIAAIKKAGGTPIYTEYKGVGHNSWERAFIEPDLLSWVFAQRTRLRNRKNSKTTTQAAASPCANALAQHAVCVVANNRAKDIMDASHLEAFTVVQDVQTGALVAFAASDPTKLDVTTPVLPLSLSKLLLAASWWDNKQANLSFAVPDSTASGTRLSVDDMLIGGSDAVGRQVAIALRKSVGTKVVLMDLNRYGFGPRADLFAEDSFWATLAATWRVRLIPGPAYSKLTATMNDTEWADTLSLGETNMMVTGIHLSRFLQAVGNNGLMLSPVAREEVMGNVRESPQQADRHPIRIMQKSTALRLQSGMRDAVKRGSARSIAKALKETGWQIGGKTGTGPGVISAQSDGWFAGLIFDQRDKARFTIATFVRHGGRGGGNAARISAELARYIIDGSTSVTFATETH